jgi:hypothetical protein
MRNVEGWRQHASVVGHHRPTFMALREGWWDL